MVEIKELQDDIEVLASGYHEKFNSRFKAIMAAHALAFGESQAQGGQQVDIPVPAGWGDAYMVTQHG